VRSKTFLAVILAVLSAGLCFPQTDSATARRIVIKIPEGVTPEAVWIRYAAGRWISRGERMQLEGNSREYVIPRARNTTGQQENVKIVLYTSGCEFKLYDLNLASDSDVEERFQCDPLPTTTLHGFIPPAEIPRSISNDKKIDVRGDLDADWICSFFLQPTGGSCLGSDVPLGILGSIDPADKGKFELTIPDFSGDPAFKRTAEWRSGPSIIEMLLQDHKVEFPLGVIKPKDSTSPVRGMQVRADYPDTIDFTRTH
jgi:hypothetical protein